MLIDLAHFIWDVFKGGDSDKKEIDEETLIEIVQDIEEARRKTDMWIKINTALFTVGFIIQITILVLLIIK